MALSLHTIKPSSGSKRSKKRVGRGHASRGITAGRGQKGQKARSGVGGLQRIGVRKLMLATPKLRGFNSLNAKNAVVNVADIEKAFAKGDVVSPETLVAKKLIASAKNGAKILGNGDISISVTVAGCNVSGSAKEKIEKAGGSIKA